MKQEIETLQDLFMDWFYQKNRTWKTLPEFLQVTHFEKVFTPRDLSDLMLGKATLPVNYATFLLQKTPYKLTPDEINMLNHQSRYKNRFAHVIEINEHNLDALEFFFKHPHATKYYSAEERNAAKVATKRKFEKKLTKLKVAKILMPLIDSIQNKLEQNGKIEPIELTEEVLKKQLNRERKRKLNELKKDPNYTPKWPKKYKTEEARIAAYKESYRKSNSGEKHAQWVEGNADKVAAYKKNWSQNNAEKAREASRNYKKRKKVKTILNLLRGIANYKETQSPTNATTVNIKQDITSNNRD